MRYLILCGLVTMLGSAQCQAQSAGIPVPADQIVSMRKSTMDLQQGIMAAMKAGVEQKADVKPFVDGAKGLVASGKLIAVMFPAGTEKVGDTKAKPAIWSDPADFAKHAQAFDTEAQKLVTLAEANDKEGFATQFAAVGKSCGACHRQYKERN